MHTRIRSLSLSVSLSFFLSFVWFNLRIMFKRFQRAYRDQRIHVGFCDAALFCDSEQGRPGSFIPHEKQGDTWSPHKEEETGASQVRVIQLWDDSLLPSPSMPLLCPFDCVCFSLSPVDVTPTTSSLPVHPQSLDPLPSEITDFGRSSCCKMSLSLSLSLCLSFSLFLSLASTRPTGLKLRPRPRLLVHTWDIEPLDDFTNVGFEPIVWRCSILVRVSFTITWRNNASKKFNEQVFDNFTLHFAIFWFFFCKRSKRL